MCRKHRSGVYVRPANGAAKNKRAIVKLLSAWEGLNED